MPVSPDGILEAAFDPAWATVRLIVDGGMWPSAVTTITIMRAVPGLAPIAVRGVETRAVVSGYFAGSDPEAPLDVPVTYSVTGLSAAGAVVATASVSVSTSGAARGLWVKVPGGPDMTCLARLAEVGELGQDTVGKNYPIAGGGSVAQAAAQSSGTTPESGTIRLSVPAGTVTRALLAALRVPQRVLLLQPVGSSDLDEGYYFVSSHRRVNPAGVESYGRRWFTLAIESTSMPAGQGQGVPGVTWAAVQHAYPTWAALKAAKPSWFDVQRGV